MRVLEVISEYLPEHWGGTQIHVRDLCRGLRARGHDLRVFTALRSDQFEDYLMTDAEWDGVPVTRVTNTLRDVDRFEMIYANPKLDARFAALLWESRPELVHFHHFTCLSTAWIEACAERGIPVVVTLHDYWLVCPRGQRLHPDTNEVCAELDRSRCVRCLNKMWPHLLPVEESADARDPSPVTSGSLYSLRRWEEHVHRMLDLAALIITPSRFHRDRFVEWGLDPARCAVVPHGLDTRGLRGEPRGRRPLRTIGYAGTLIPSKGVHVLLDAFQRLGRADLTLAIHGQALLYHGDAGYADRLRAAVAPGLDVRFGGAYRQEELGNVLAGLDALVVPSIWWETFGLTVREGALAGLPVVAAEIGGLGEAVAEGLALGFRAGDAEDLARVLARLIDDADLRDAMSRKGALVRDIADCAAETEAHYSRVLAAQSAAPPVAR